MNNSQEHLTGLFFKAIDHISNGNWSLEIVNSNKFKELVTHYKMSFFPDEQTFNTLQIFDKKQIDEYAINFLLYKWLLDHEDRRYRHFSFIIKPHNRQFDLREVSFEDLMHFVSPETKKTNGN